MKKYVKTYHDKCSESELMIYLKFYHEQIDSLEYKILECKNDIQVWWQHLDDLEKEIIKRWDSEINEKRKQTI